MLDGKTILVTGATSGIGRKLCLELLKQNANLIAIGRSEERLRELADLSGSVQIIRADLNQLHEYPEKFRLTTKIDGLVYSAGIYETTLMRYFSTVKHENIMRINLTAPLALIAQLLKQKDINSGASIVLLSSILGPITGLAGSVSYAASKAALVGCAKTLALELAKYSIRVNCVSPGMVDTEMTNELGYMSAEASAADKAKYPLGARYATTQEVTAAIQFLLSDAASFITGSNLVIDGGCSVQ